MVCNLFVGYIKLVEMEGELKKYFVVSWTIVEDGLKRIYFLDKSIVLSY